MAFATRGHVAVAAAVVFALAGCAPRASGPGGMPRGVVFVRDLPVEDKPYYRRDPERTRVFREGRLVAHIVGRVFPARDTAAGSLVYDYQTRMARAMAGGRSWPFDPCPDQHNGIHFLALSPDGRRGICTPVASHSERLVLFDARKPAQRRVIFDNATFGLPHVAAWIDNERIAVVEYRKHGCRFYNHYGDPPAGLVVIDVSGRILERGPCMAGVVAGPRGPVYVDYFVNVWHFLDPIWDQPRDRMVFSTDQGRSWRTGDPQFADADGRVFSHGDNHDWSLRDENGTVLVRGVWQAAWARP
jgi:hypothetical protein